MGEKRPKGGGKESQREVCVPPENGIASLSTWGFCVHNNFSYPARAEGVAKGLKNHENENGHQIRCPSSLIPF